MTKITLYTDGGYSRKILAGSSAYALVGSNDEVLWTESFLIDDPKWLESWNIGPELFAAMEGVKQATEQGYDEIHIVYDYVGVKYWANGYWKKQDKWYKKRYINYFNSIRNRVTLTYKHVKGHNGCKYNEMVDHLCTKELKDYKCHLKEIGLKRNPKILIKS